MGREQGRLGETARLDTTLTPSEGESKERLGESILDFHSLKKLQQDGQNGQATVTHQRRLVFGQNRLTLVSLLCCYSLEIAHGKKMP